MKSLCRGDGGSHSHTTWRAATLPHQGFDVVGHMFLQRPRTFARVIGRRRSAGRGSGRPVRRHTRLNWPSDSSSPYSTNRRRTEIHCILFFHARTLYVRVLSALLVTSSVAFSASVCPFYKKKKTGRAIVVAAAAACPRSVFIVTSPCRIIRRHTSTRHYIQVPGSLRGIPRDQSIPQ